MKGKIWKALLAVVSCACLCFGVVACGFVGNSSSSSFTQSENSSTSTGNSSSVERTENSSDNASTSESSEESDSLAYSEGLMYECSKDKTYYIVRGLGLCSERDVVIPDSYNGLPVKEIAGDAFDREVAINSVVIPDSVTTIGIYAFWECDSLTSVVIGDGVTSIGLNAFSGCDSLTSVVIGDGLISINSYAFADCSNLQRVVIGSSIRTIGESAFVGIGTNQIVCYKGSAEEWKKIEIEKNNSYLMWSTIYYYVENEADVPADGGNYWHYDENGEIVVW